MTDTQPIIDTAIAAAEPNDLGNNVISVLVPDGARHQIDDLQKYEDRPRRKTGTAKTHDANAFTTYVNKHSLEGTEVWADEENTRVIAVLNAHDTTQPGWGDHRALLAARKTDAWKAWTGLDRNWMSQQDFAEHIEDRAIDIAKPTGAQMLELAQHFQASLGGEFESSKRLSNGEAQLVYKETVTAKAGQRGQLDIPAEIELGLRPFQGAPAYKVKARFRYRITNGQLRMSYALERPEDVIREAFADVTSTIAGDLGNIPVLMGWPE